jgi:hypothetical protein
VGSSTAGAERAIRCARAAGLEDDTALTLADAITIAANPGMDPAVDGIGATGPTHIFSLRQTP